MFKIQPLIRQHAEQLQPQSTAYIYKSIYIYSFADNAGWVCNSDIGTSIGLCRKHQVKVYPQLHREHGLERLTALSDCLGCVIGESQDASDSKSLGLQTSDRRNIEDAKKLLSYHFNDQKSKGRAH